MERRDFILRMSLVFLASSIGSLSKNFKLKRSIAPQKPVLDNNRVISQAGTFYFPKNPEIISTILCFDIKTSDKVTFTSPKDKINRQDQDLELIGPGKYTAQYLGPNYGWSVI